MQNKLIASTMTQRTFTLDVALDKLLEAGFDTIELCSVDAWVPHFDVANATDETVKQTAELIKSKGIKVHCLFPPPFHPYITNMYIAGPQEEI